MGCDLSLAGDQDEQPKILVDNVTERSEKLMADNKNHFGRAREERRTVKQDKFVVSWQIK